MHVGSSSNLIKTSDDMPTLAFMAYSAPVNQAGTLLDWLFSGNFERFPKLKIALSEGSIGWIPTSSSRPSRSSTSSDSGCPGSTST